MAQRVERIVGHLSPSSKPAELTTGLASKAGSAATDDDVVIVSALRTPIGRGKRGNLKVRHFNVFCFFSRLSVVVVRLFPLSLCSCLIVSCVVSVLSVVFDVM